MKFVTQGLFSLNFTFSLILMITIIAGLTEVFDSKLPEMFFWMFALLANMIVFIIVAVWFYEYPPGTSNMMTYELRDKEDAKNANTEEPGQASPSELISAEDKKNSSKGKKKTKK